MSNPFLPDQRPHPVSVESTSAATDTNPPAAAVADETPLEFTPSGQSGLSIIKAPDHGLHVGSSHAELEAAASALPDFVLGETTDILPLSGLAALRVAATRLLPQARRELLLISTDLESLRFNNDDFVSALSAFARSSRYTCTRILIADPRPAVEEGHRLVRLARRLSELVEIRQAHEHDLEHLPSVLVVDGMGVLRCTSRDPWQGTLNVRAIGHGKRYREQFLEWWERAHEVTDFREMSL